MKCTASLAATATVQRLRIGVADVLGREADQPSRDVQRVLAGFHHARQPVDGGVRIAVAHRLVQRGDEVVVLLADLVVEQRPALHRLLRRARRQRCCMPSTSGRRADASSSRFSADRASPLAWRRSPCRASGSTSTASRRGRDRASAQRTFEDRDDLLACQPAQHEHLRTRQQRGVDLERRVLGRRADQHDVAGLDARKEGILLRLVEPVNLVDEDDRAADRSCGAAARLRP